MRKAVIGDLEKVTNLLWKYADKVAISTPNYNCVVAHIIDLIEDDNSIIIVNNEISAIGAARLVDDEFSYRLLSYGLWLVSDKPKEGLKVAKSLVQWSIDNNAIPICSAVPELTKFYSRLSMKPRELVFIGV